MNCYDTLADVYDYWVLGDEASLPCEAFYQRLCLEATGTLIEIGVGTGRIAIELAKSGRTLTGIDVSESMLAICRQKAKQFGVSSKLTLCQMDVQNLAFHNIDLITLPFRTLGHFITPVARREVFEQIFKALAPGGKFVFDHYISDCVWAQAHNAIPRLMYRSLPNKTEGLLIWDTYHYDISAGMMDCLITIERTDHNGVTVSRKHVTFPFAWVDPEEIELLASETGFVIEAMYGTFDATTFFDDSPEQIWILRKDNAR